MERKLFNTPREYVAQIIKQGVIDRIPKGELCIDDAVIRRELACKQVEFEERLAFTHEFGLDIYTIAPIYPESGRRLPVASECLWPDVDKWVKSTSLFTFGILDGAFEWGLRVLGVEKFLMLPKTSPLTLQEFVLQVEKFNQSMIQQLGDRGINGIIIADDVAINGGLMVNPRTLKEFFFPSMFRQVEEIKKFNIPTFYHSDGDYHTVINEVVEAGFVGLHCIDRNAGMDVIELQGLVANRLCLWGHLDISDSNDASNPQFLHQLSMNIQHLAQGNKFILGTNSGLFEGMNMNGLRQLYKSLI